MTLREGESSASFFEKYSMKGFFSETMKSFRARRTRRLDKKLLTLIIVLLVVGLLSLGSASYAYAYYNKGNSGYYIIPQIGFALAGVAAMLVVSYIPVVYYKKMIPYIYPLTLVLLGLVFLFPGKNGIHRWINIGVSFQPSELAKFVVIILGAYWGSEYYPKRESLRVVKDRPRAPKKFGRVDRITYNVGSYVCRLTSVLKYSVMPYLLAVAPIAGLIVIETHISCTVIILVIAASLIFVSGMSWKFILPLIGVAAVGLYIVIFSGWIPYSSARIEVWRNPLDPDLDTWQVRQSLYAISNGGLLGQGILNSTQKYLYISEPQNDFIFAVVCEELGFVGALLIIGLFITFVCYAFIVSTKNPNNFAKLLGIGIAAQIGWQTFFNIGVVTNALPNTGISLPFFSYGGTSMVMLLMEMGVLLAVSRDSLPD